MESDLYIPGNVIYTDRYSIKTSNDTGSQIIAGSTTHSGYQEGTGSAARFNYIYGFTQISSTQIVVSDTSNVCLRLVDRVSGRTLQFSGQCRKGGYQDGSPALFSDPRSIIKDVKKPDQLIVADSSNNALRSVNLKARVVSTLVKSDVYLARISQDEQSGDLFLIAGNQILRFIYRNNKVQLVTGSEASGYADGYLHIACLPIHQH